MGDEPRRSGQGIHQAAADGFARSAKTYARGRPDYPPQVDEWLRDDLGVRPGWLVLELGAGTGKFTVNLIASGAQVIAVEPVAQMLEQLRQAVPAVAAIVGTAEKIPVPDGCADAVVCAQSFHWFANHAALSEISRVVRPGGNLGLIWNVRDQSFPWVAALTALIAPYEGDAPRYDSGNWRELFPAPGWGALQERRFHQSHGGPPEQVIVDRTLSISFIAALPQEEQRRLAARVRELIAATPDLAGRTEVTFPYVTMAYRAARL